MQMASSKSYAYYLRGSQIALVQEDLTSDGKWKSPVEAITDGLEIEYAYSPRYFIESTDVSTTTASGWDQDNDGNFRLRAAGGTDWTSSPNLSGIPSASSPYIVLKNAGRFNGLHKVSSVAATRIVTTTKVSASTSNTDFEETVTLYYDVNVLNDEADTIDIPEYLCKALVYYVKAKIAEDKMDMEAKAYFLREFRAIVERHESSKSWGSRRVIPGAHSIR